MKTAAQTLFHTCQELMGKRYSTFEEFIKECEKDKVFGEGVTSVCEAMERHAQPYRQELQKALVTIQKLREEKEKLPKVTRVEVIDQDGRSYTNWDKNNKVELSYQDNGETLKVFITRPPLDS